VAYEKDLAGTGHHWGYATCEWLRHCQTANEYVGSLCGVTKNGHYHSGYCFTSDTGSLECGRMIDTTDKYNIMTQVTEVRSRCPRGAPATSIGSVVSKRLLVGGCMIADDFNFTAAAEVHVPQMCFLPKDYKKGCMFPGATNYDPAAVSPGNCYYRTQGCTAGNAVNYNPEAYINDGSCITRVEGCTVKNAVNSYMDVPSDVPKYQTRHVGVNVRAIGDVTLPTYGTVTKYDEGANVNVGCVVAIEGCMTQGMVNYDARATVNSNTWCIPPVTGCMMPNWNAVETNRYFGGASPADTKIHHRDGGSSNFNPLATVHVQSECKVERYGCMDSAAFNYDPHATINFDCYPNAGACFDDAALNFNCTAITRDVTDVDGVLVGTILSSPCTDNPGPRGTFHDQGLCVTSVPTPEELYQNIPDNAGEIEMTVSVVIDAICQEVGKSDADRFNEKFQVALENDEGEVWLVEVGCGSTVLNFKADMKDKGRYDAVKDSVKTKYSTLAATSAALGVTALSLPTVTAKYKGGNDDWALIGGAIGGTLGGLLLLGICFVMAKRKGKKVEA